MAGVSYAKCDVDGNIIGWGFVSVEMVSEQMREPGEGLLPATGDQVIAMGLAAMADEPMPFVVDFEAQTVVTVLEYQDVINEETGEISTVAVSNELTFPGLVVHAS